MVPATADPATADPATANPAEANLAKANPAKANPAGGNPADGVPTATGAAADDATAQLLHPADQRTATLASPGKPFTYTARKSVTPPPPAIPLVLLSEGHKRLCKVDVGDSFPQLSLPRLGGPTTALASLRGKQATVVLFWHPDRWMARMALVDMQRDVASKFPAEKVAVVGIAVRQAAGPVQTSLNEVQATFPQLLDTSGTAFAAVGSAALPRIYVLNTAGKIVWFDIEYSEGTRRELQQALDVLMQP